MTNCLTPAEAQLLAKVRQLNKISNEKAHLWTVSTSSIHGSGAVFQETVLPPTFIGLISVCVGTNRRPEFLKAMYDEGLHPVNCGPPALRHSWLRTDFGRMLNEDVKNPTCIGQHWVPNGSRHEVANKPHHVFGEYKLAVTIKRVSVDDEATMKYTLYRGSEY